MAHIKLWLYALVAIAVLSLGDPLWTSLAFVGIFAVWGFGMAYSVHPFGTTK